MYKAVIFDLDGTLLNTLEDLKDSVNHVLKEYDYPTRTLEEVRNFVGNGIHKLIERAVPQETDLETVEKIFEDFREYYGEHCRIKTTPYEGIKKVLGQLKEMGFKMAVVSNKNHEAVQELIPYYFGDLLPVAIGQKEGIATKPAPDSVYEAMRILQVEKKDCVYVGDSDVDRATASNAGIDCISVTWGFRSEEMLRELKPEYLISKPEEIVAIVAN